MPKATTKPGGSLTAESGTLGQIKQLQHQLASSSDLNPLSDLLALAKKQARFALEASDHSDKDRRESTKAVHRCLQILTRCLKSLCGEDKVVLDRQVDSEGYIMSSGGSNVDQSNKSDAEKLVQDWIRMRWNEAIELFCALLGHDVELLRMSSLELLVDIQMSASSSLTRLHAKAVTAASAFASLATSSSSSSSKNNKNVSTPSLVENPQGQWSISPWRALILSLIVGPPSLSHLGSGEAGNKKTVTRQETIAQDVRQKFADSGMEEYDDVRLATLWEISTALRKPSPSATKMTSLRANTLSLLLLLTAIPTDAADLNHFLVSELSIPPLGPSQKGKKKANPLKAGSLLKVTDDGDSDQDANQDQEDDNDMSGWFSDSDKEGDGGPVDKKKAQDRQTVVGLGAAAKKATAVQKQRKRKRATFHEALHLIQVQRAAFSTAWLDLLQPRRITDEETGNSIVLGGMLSLTATHQVLVRLHAQILPHLSKPALLHDFLSGCLDCNGVTALLALNALFTLVTKYNLDYPQFYTRLYALIDSSVLHMKYRARFLRLLDVFLSSTHLSAALVASFIKRLSRLAIRAPPAAIASILPFVWNLFKKHPSCLGMIHKEWNGDRLEIGPAGVDDPYDPFETDPLKTGALESSLWELASLGSTQSANTSHVQVGSNETLAPGGVERGGDSHYLGSVTSLAKILAEPFTKQRYDLEDFLDITYGTLFETETNKTLKATLFNSSSKIKIPAIRYSLPGGYGGGNNLESTLPGGYARIDVFPTELGRKRALDAQRKAEEEEELEIQKQQEERKRKDKHQQDEEDQDEKEAREAIEQLKRQERNKKRKIEQTGTHDLCAQLFHFG